MNDVLSLPPLMGMFCTGYVLHRAWAWWHNRRVRKQMAQIALMKIVKGELDFNIIWQDWAPEASEVRRAA